MPALWSCRQHAPLLHVGQTHRKALHCQWSIQPKPVCCHKQRVQRKKQSDLLTTASHLCTATAVAADPKLMQTVDVSLGDRSYPIYIGQGLLDNSDILQRHVLGKKILVVTNETVAPLYLDRCSFHSLCTPHQQGMSPDTATFQQVSQDSYSWWQASSGSGHSARWRAIQEPGGAATSVGQGTAEQVGQELHICSPGWRCHRRHVWLCCRFLPEGSTLHTGASLLSYMSIISALRMLHTVLITADQA